MPPADAKKTNRLMALGSAAVMAVYAAGYFRTAPAAARLAAAERSRVVIPQEARDNHGAVAPAVQAAQAEVPGPGTRPPDITTPAVPSRRPARNKPAASPAPALPIEAPAAATVTPAPAPVPTPEPAPATQPTPVYKDGKYTGWGTSRHGDIEATVTIENGRIASAIISQCLTRYSCSWVTHLQGQVVTRQSPEVDYVSGATQSANAFYWAVTQALSKAK